MPAYVPDPPGRIIHSRKQSFRIEVVTKGLEMPWAMAFLPDGRKIVTERPGRLRIIDKAGEAVAGACEGARRRWWRTRTAACSTSRSIPISPGTAGSTCPTRTLRPGYAPPATPELGPNGRPVFPPMMTVMVRGHINARNEWVDNQEIFRAPADLYTGKGEHFGSRFAFDRQGHLFYSLGERGDMTNAQRLDVPLGKIHRVNDDGSVPADNPFVHTPGAIPTIWTYGHRNPEGLAFDPTTGLL